MVTATRNPQKALQAIAMYAEKEYGVGGNKAINKTRLQAEGYIFSEDIIRHTVSGETSTLEFNSSDMNSISVND